MGHDRTTVSCQACGYSFDAKTDTTVRSATCPSCAGPVTVPAATPAVAEDNGLEPITAHHRRAAADSSSGSSVYAIPARRVIREEPRPRASSGRMLVDVFKDRRPITAGLAGALLGRGRFGFGLGRLISLALKLLLVAILALLVLALLRLFVPDVYRSIIDGVGRLIGSLRGVVGDLGEAGSQ